MKSIYTAAAAALAIGVAAGQAQGATAHTLVVTASNAPASNHLLVYNSSDKLVQDVATGGKGGASGNSGGIAVWKDLLAVVNFGSQTVSVFERSGDAYSLKHIVPTASAPLSVAFGHGHLYILGATTVESHPVYDSVVGAASDGQATLLKADGSAAQVGVLDTELVITEKSNTIEAVGLDPDYAVIGAPALTANIPANVNAPFGLATRGNEAYVTIAHANEISLVRDNAVLAITGSGTQNAPCWLALDGPFLFSANSPSQSISRYVVYGKNIVQDAAVAASGFVGNPTDIAYRKGLLAVVDGANGQSHLTVFHVDEDGNLAATGRTAITGTANGVAIVLGDE
jgi:hypothetical protein